MAPTESAFQPEASSPAPCIDPLENFRILADIYKHHWDLFLKGFALYLVACSVIAGYTVSQNIDPWQRVSAGAAISVASLFSFWGVNVSQRWLTTVVTKLVSLASESKVETFEFDGPIRILDIMRLITIVFFISGLTFVAYLAIVAARGAG